MFEDDWFTADGTCIRAYIHVVDLADAHELALFHAVPGEHRIYNLGNGTGFSGLPGSFLARSEVDHAGSAVRYRINAERNDTRW